MATRIGSTSSFVQTPESLQADQRIAQTLLRQIVDKNISSSHTIPTLRTEQEYKDLEVQIRDLQKILDSIGQENTVLKTTTTTKDQEVQDLSHRIDVLANQLRDEQTTHQGDLHSKTVEIDDLKTQLDNKLQEVQDKQTEVDDLTNVLATLRGTSPQADEVVKQQEQIKKLGEELRLKTDEATDKQTEVTNLSTRITTLETEVQTLTTAQAEEQRKAQEALKTLSDELILKTDEATDKQTEVTNLSTRITTLETEVQTLTTAQTEEQRKAQEALKTLSDELILKTDEATDKQTEVTNLSTRITTLEAEVQKLTTTQTEEQSKAQEALKTLGDELILKTDEATDKQTEVTNLSTRITTLETEVQTLTTAQAEEQRKAQEALKTLSEELRLKTEEASIKQTELTNLSDQITTLRGSVSSSPETNQAEIVKLQEEIEKLNKILNLLAEQAKNKAAEVDSLTTRLVIRETINNSLKADSQTHQVQIYDLIEKLKIKEEELHNKIVESQTLETNRETLTKRFNEQVELRTKLEQSKNAEIERLRNVLLTKTEELEQQRKIHTESQENLLLELEKKKVELEDTQALSTRMLESLQQQLQNTGNPEELRRLQDELNDKKLVYQLEIDKLRTQLDTELREHNDASLEKDTEINNLEEQATQLREKIERNKGKHALELINIDNSAQQQLEEKIEKLQQSQVLDKTTSEAQYKILNEQFDLLLKESEILNKELTEKAATIAIQAAQIKGREQDIEQLSTKLLDRARSVNLETKARDENLILIQKITSLETEIAEKVLERSRSSGSLGKQAQEEKVVLEKQIQILTEQLDSAKGFELTAKLAEAALDEAEKDNVSLRQLVQTKTESITGFELTIKQAEEALETSQLELAQVKSELEALRLQQQAIDKVNDMQIDQILSKQKEAATKLTETKQNIASFIPPPPPMPQSAPPSPPKVQQNGDTTTTTTSLDQSMLLNGLSALRKTSVASEEREFYWKTLPKGLEENANSNSSSALEVLCQKAEVNSWLERTSDEIDSCINMCKAFSVKLKDLLEIDAEASIDASAVKTFFSSIKEEVVDEDWGDDAVDSSSSFDGLSSMIGQVTKESSIKVAKILTRFEKKLEQLERSNQWIMNTLEKRRSAR